MYKACPYCGRIHRQGDKCPAFKRIYKSTKETKLRNRNQWKMKSLEIRDKAEGLCEVCRDQGKINYKGLEVHHIVKLKDNPDGLLDDMNLVCLCSEHHKQADRGELSQEYLKSLACNRESK